jgi:acyl carrier protein
MDRSTITEALTEIFKDVIDNDTIILNDETKAGDVDGWDSLTHIQLVVAIEKHFKIRFTSKEIQGWRNVGELINSIEAK